MGCIGGVGGKTLGFFVWDWWMVGDNTIKKCKKEIKKEL
jgi:hypothetical protein